MKHAGEYRAFYIAFWDDVEQQALGDQGYRVLTTLKGTLPAIGLGVLNERLLAVRCNYSLDQVRAALTELAHPKRADALGWIVQEGGVVWIRRALEFNPALQERDRKHRTFVQKSAAALGDRPIVRAFKDYYAGFFRPDSAADSDHDESPKGLPRALHAPSYKTEDETSDVDNSESEARPRATSAPPTTTPAPRAPSDPRSLAGLPTIRERFFATFYASASVERRTAVARQLDETLTPAGCRVKGAMFATATADTLSAALESTLLRPPRQVDRAIVFVLRKLLDHPVASPIASSSYLSRAEAPPGPRRRRRAQSGPVPIAEVDAAVCEASDLAAALAWIRPRADELRAIEARVDTQMTEINPTWREHTFATGWRARLIESAVLAHYRSVYPTSPSSPPAPSHAQIPKAAQSQSR